MRQGIGVSVLLTYMYRILKKQNWPFRAGWVELTTYGTIIPLSHLSYRASVLKKAIGQNMCR